MFNSLGEQLKSSAKAVVRNTSLLAVVAFSLLLTVSFLCAAAFIVVMQNFGTVLACLSGAGIFGMVALVTVGSYVQLKRKKRASPPLSRLAVAMSEPMVAAAGVQIVRAVGVKRLLPLLAVGGIAFVLMTQRRPEQRQNSR